MQLDDLGGVEIGCCQLGKLDHQNGANGKVRGNQTVGVGKDGSDLTVIGLGETRCADHGMNATLGVKLEVFAGCVEVGEVDDHFGIGDDERIEPSLAAEIAPVEDGPLFVSGGISIERADGEPIETRNRVVLCRCGGSQNKPLCDGSHIDNGFRS